MNRKSRAKSSSLFLLELILAILFFSIASAVCVQIFVKSHLMSADAQALNLAVSECSGVAEVIAASDSEDAALEQLAVLYPEAAGLDPAARAQDDDTSGSDASGKTQDDEALCIYYDDTLQPCGEKAAAYELTVLLDREGTMLSADLQMNRVEDDSSLYSLTVDRHIQREAGHE